MPEHQGLPEHQRVVITGMGVVCPLGRELETLWQNLMTGVSGITELGCLPAAGNT
ncbi:MAG: beta-ketoacyl synthase N-terminal-like domain-containing protein, partial [Pirellula sp.]